jgi:hypothetical protein
LSCRQNKQRWKLLNLIVLDAINFVAGGDKILPAIVAVIDSDRHAPAPIQPLTPTPPLD